MERRSSEKFSSSEIDATPELQEEEDRLARHFDTVESRKYEINNNEKKREELKRDVMLMCRHALATGADAMMFCDRHARGYGLICRKILPSMRIEYARLFGKDLSEIKLPDVVFFDPVRKGLNADDLINLSPDRSWWEGSIGVPMPEDTEKYNKAKKYQGELNTSYLSELYNKLLYRYEGRTILICDESSGDADFTRLMKKMSEGMPAEQYKNFLPFASDSPWGKFKSEKLSKKSDSETKELRTTAIAATIELSVAFPGIKFEPHVGMSPWLPGFDGSGDPVIAWGIQSHQPQEKVFGPIRVEYIDVDSDPELDPLRMDPDAVRYLRIERKKLKTQQYKPFVKRASIDDVKRVNEKYGRRYTDEDIAKYRNQLRQEYLQIAEEVFNEVVVDSENG